MLQQRSPAEVQGEASGLMAILLMAPPPDALLQSSFRPAKAIELPKLHRRPAKRFRIDELRCLDAGGMVDIVDVLLFKPVIGASYTNP